MSFNLVMKGACRSYEVARLPRSLTNHKSTTSGQCALRIVRAQVTVLEKNLLLCNYFCPMLPPVDQNTTISKELEINHNYYLLKLVVLYTKVIHIELV